MAGNESSILIIFKDLTQIDLDTELGIDGKKEFVLGIQPHELSSIEVLEDRIILLGFDKTELRIALPSDGIDLLLDVVSKSVAKNE